MNTLHKQIALKLDKTNKRIQIFEIDHNLSLSVNFILKVTETLKTFLFQHNHFLLFRLSDACLAEKQQIPI
jgi:hypothetical protein